MTTVVSGSPCPEVRLRLPFESGATLVPTDARAGLIFPQKISAMTTPPMADVVRLRYATGQLSASAMALDPHGKNRLVNAVYTLNPA